MKKYLITGGAGFIGSNLIKYLLEKHKDILIVNLDLLTYAGNIESIAEIMDDKRQVFIKGDICDRELVSSLFAEHEFDIVINLAAESHVDRSIHSSEVFGRTNFMGTLNILNCAKDAWYDGDIWKKGKKFVQISTDEVYGSLGEEGYFTEETSLDPHSPYSASKAAADMIVKSYYDTYNMPVNITRCSNNYGPYQFPEKLIPLMICNIIKNKPLPLYGDGLNVRDWLFVDDHCAAIDLVTSAGASGEIYNIGGNCEKRNICMVDNIVSLLGKLGIKSDNSRINYVKDRKGHDRRYAIDTIKIKRELGWQPKISFEEGLLKTIVWYIENENWLNDIISGDYIKFYELNYEK